MQTGLDIAIARMTADIEAVCALFGYAAQFPSRLNEELTPHAPELDPSVAPPSESQWTARAARLISVAASGGDSAIRQCAAIAFDDLDARVRGIAWCVLAEIERVQGLQDDSVRRIVAEAFIPRAAPPSEPAEREGDASTFAVLVGAVVLIRAGDYFIQNLEREYIDAHGGVDASQIESSTVAALAFLDHPDSGRRLAALRVVARAPKGNTSASEALYRKAISDTESDVMRAAIVAYGEFFAGTGDPQCLARLAAIVLDEDRLMFQRFAAYYQLFKVSGSPLDTRAPMLRPDDEKLSALRDDAKSSEWPTPVDWGFVQRCAALWRN